MISSAIRRLATALTGRPTRVWLLPSLGAACGLLLAGVAMFRPAPQSSVVPPGFVAMVNNKGVLLSDFKTQATAATGKAFEKTTEVERRKVLNDMINEELLVQRGVLLDLPETTTEIRDVMTAAVNAQIDAGIKGQVPTDAELRAFYDSRRGNYSAPGIMFVRDLVLRVGGYQNIEQTTVQAQADAAEAVYQLRSGVPLDRVMQHYGLEDSGRADKGETLDFAAKLHLGAKLFDIASTLRNGDISDPVPDDDGVHILIMQDRVPPRVADFGSVRAKVHSDYLDAASKRAQAEGIKILRKDAIILLAPGETL